MGSWSFAGAALVPEWYDADDAIIYMNTQIGDPFVPCDVDHALLGFRDCESNPLCGQLWQRYPQVSGACAMQAYYDGQSDLPAAVFDILDCDTVCNSVCHWWPEISTLIDSIAHFFSREALAISSMKIVDESNFSIFPNPATTVINILVPEDIGHYSISMFNSVGQRIYFDENVIQIKLNASFTHGLYVIEIRSTNKSNKNSIAKKMIIQ